MSTLWPVDDVSTRRFMVAFYRALARRAPREEALHEAMRRVYREDPDPHHGSGFVLEGGLGTLPGAS